MDINVLAWGLVFGAFGAAYFVYGKNRDVPVAKYCGIALVIFPMFVYNLYIMIPLGVLFMILPFILKDYF